MSSTITALTSGGGLAMAGDTSGQLEFKSDTTKLGLVGTGTTTAFGCQALNSNTGAYNTGVGYTALFTNSTGEGNTALGRRALYSNTTANDNTAIGNQALYTNSTGTANVALGQNALVLNTTASYNTAIGYQAGYSSTVGTGNNTFLGYRAGYSMTDGSYNTILGSQDTTLVGGSYNALIGRYANVQSSTTSYALVINTDNTARTDKGNGSGYIFTGGSMYQGNNSSSWAVTSDQRLKKNIVDNTDGLDKITAIQVRNFEYRLPEEVDAELKATDAVEKTGVQIGVIAQELAQVLPDCVKQESTGVFSVDTDNLTWYLVNAVKELNAKVTALEEQVINLGVK